MGEQADMIIEGECCALCGCFFEEEQGYPCVCIDCYEPDCGYPNSEEETI